MRRFFARFHDWCRRRSVVAAFDEEMRFHLEELAAEYQRRGLSEEAARTAARREFGNVIATRESLRAQAGCPPLEEIARDTSLAFRSLSRRPGMAFGVILVLALGLGAALALVVLVDAVFLRPLPVAAPAELYLVREPDGGPALFSAGTARRFAETLPEGCGVASHATPSRATVQRGAAPAEHAEVQLVEGRFFSVLGLQPLVGRLLVPGDDAVGAPASVAVVGESWARERFGTPLAALGGEVRINRHPVTIVGVVPDRFAGLIIGGRVQLWLPAGLQPFVHAAGNAATFSSNDRPNDPDWNREERTSWMQLLVRVPGSANIPVLPVLQAAARPAREDIARQIEDPEEQASLLRLNWELEPAKTGYSHLRASFGSTSQLLAGIIAALLLLTSANVSNLLLVRTLARHREMGVRLALGAGSWRVCRLALIEALVLAALGAIGAALLATWLAPLAASLLTPHAQLDLRIVAWRPLVVLSALAIIVSGLCAGAPSAWIARLDPLVALAGRAGATRSPLRLGRALVVVQVALAAAVVTVAVAITRELHRLLTTDPGFATHQVLTATFDPGSAGYQGDAALSLYDRIEDAVRRLPGVEAVGFSSNGILAGSHSRSRIYPRGEGALVRSGPYQSDSVRPGYFDAVGLTLLQGRVILASDTATTPRVAVVTEAFAREIFGEVDVIGRRFGYGATPDEQDWAVVGVVADARVNTVAGDPPPLFFIPVAQASNDLRFLAIRFSGPPATLTHSLREVLAAMEPGLVWSRWQSLAERMAGNVRDRVAMSRLIWTLAGAALLLATLGVGVSLAHLVVLRRREIAIRIALGADRRRIRRQILLDASRIGAAGALLGLGLIVVLSRLPIPLGILDVLLDPWTFGIALMAGAGAAALGAWRPACQATRIDPQRWLAAE
jgi:predicted permease